MPKLKAPEGSRSCSHEGTTYETDADGNVEVPDEAVVELVSHGFVPAPAETTKLESATDVKKGGKR